MEDRVLLYSTENSFPRLLPLCVVKYGNALLYMYCGTASLSVYTNSVSLAWCVLMAASL